MLRCADGSLARECYVAEVELPPGVELAEGDLIQGVLEPVAYPALDIELGVLRANEVLTPLLGTDGGHVGLLFDTGIRCITTPCASIGYTPVNRLPTFSDFELELAVDPAALARIQEALSDELAGPGALVRGTITWHYDRKARR